MSKFQNSHKKKQSKIIQVIKIEPVDENFQRNTLKVETVKNILKQGERRKQRWSTFLIAIFIPNFYQIQ